MSKAAQQTWLQDKIRIFSHKMVTRHTYNYNSFEHIRDRIALYALPSYASQFVLAKQRANMINFLDKNEKNALEGVRQYFDIDTERWDKILQKSKKKHTFNLTAMRQSDTATGHHDKNVPSEYLDAVNKEAARYGINSKNLTLELTTDAKVFASAAMQDRQIHIQFNQNGLSRCDHHLLSHVTTHEFTHIISGHCIIEITILDQITQSTKISKKANLLLKQREELNTREEELYNKTFVSDRLLGNAWEELHSQRKKLIKDMQEGCRQLKLANSIISDYRASNAQKALRDAKEKRADTYTPCQDPEAAKNAVLAIKSIQKAGRESYPDNYNDMNVIHANWQTSQAIMNFEQLKKVPQHKLSTFARSLRDAIRS